jgi:hypothetical protein
METDTIRPSGSDTLVDMWIEGKMRGVCVSRGAIEAYLGLMPDQSATMTEDDRCEFVRNHLTLVMSAARNRLQDTSLAAGSIVIEPGQLGGSARAAGDRRKTERRKSERRKADRPEAIPVQGDRRRADRRRGERRSKPKE